MSGVPAVRHEVQIITLERALRTKKEIREKARSLLGKKMTTRFGKDAVDCPVLERRVGFLECYVCPNYIRRFKGKVHCKGLQIS